MFRFVHETHEKSLEKRAFLCYTINREKPDADAGH